MTTYKQTSFMAVIDGASKFFDMHAASKDGAIADLKATYGEDAVIEIYLWQVA